jgi:RNA polymerase sigma-70 factor (ECF subfamily)
MDDQLHLYNAFANHNLIAFEHVFRHYFPRLKKYASHFVSNPDEAEDLVQDTFVQIWNDREKLNRDKNISALLFTVLRNKCINQLKRHIIEDKYVSTQIRFQSEELYHISFNHEDEYISVQEQLNKELDDLINSMPEKCAICFRMKWIDGMKIKEIAEKLDISTTMVDKHLSRGMKIAKEKVPSRHLLLLLVLHSL